MYFSISQITDILNGMGWVIAPYAESDNIIDHPHIESLARSYNSILESLESQGFDHTFSYFTL